MSRTSKNDDGDTLRVRVLRWFAALRPKTDPPAAATPPPIAPSHKTLREIIEEQKAAGTHRVYEANETLRDPEAFREAMRKVHEDYLNKSAASIAALRDKYLD